MLHASVHLRRRVQRWLSGVHARQDEYLDVHRPDEATVRSWSMFAGAGMYGASF
jgi:hypothetical protein